MKTLRVLVPVDGSPLSEAILPYVAGLGCSAATLVQVIEPPSLFGSAPDDQAREAEARAGLDRLATGLARAGVADVKTIVRRGKPADEIAAVAGEVAPGLIAMTTHGRAGFDAIVLGTVAARLIRTISFPVLAVQAARPPGPDAPPIPPFTSIVVPHDGSDLASRAIATLGLLGLAGRARLTLLGVVDTFEAPTAPPPPGSGRDLAREYTELRKEGLRRELERAAARARDMGFDAAVEIDAGQPAARICDRAAALPASSIAMTTHGRSGLTRWALGSVTEQVLRATSVPLLVCR
ncbi:MAG TPA: universal stress protein [Planctomycetota bacterium]|nr:universal stress protein [Planctomycetota bacterium]